MMNMPEIARVISTSWYTISSCISYENNVLEHRFNQLMATSCFYAKHLLLIISFSLDILETIFVLNIIADNLLWNFLWINIDENNCIYSLKKERMMINIFFNSVKKKFQISELKILSKHVYQRRNSIQLQPFSLTITRM